MHKNKTRLCQQAMRYVQQALDIDAEDPHALPGSDIGALKQAHRKLLQAVQVKKTRREREEHRKGGET